MHPSPRSFTIGAASGAITYGASVLALGYTSALAMPRGFPLPLWGALVVFGLGAAVVALLVHLVAIRVVGARIPWALAGFAAAVVAALAVTGGLATGGKALAAWLVGAVLASAVHRLLGPGKPVERSPLRGAA